MIKKNMIFVWILSYLTVTLIPFICSGIIYSRAKAAIKNEFVINSTQEMDKFKMSVDNIVMNMSSIPRNLWNDESVSRLCYMPENTPYTEYVGDAFLATKKIQKILSANPYLSEAYIYYKNIDLITANHHMYTRKSFYDHNFNDSDLTYEEWTSAFEHNNYAVSKLITYSGGSRQTVDVFYQIPEFLTEFDAMVVLSIDTATLLNDAKMVTDLYSDVGMFILSKDGEVIMTNGVVDKIPENSKDCTVISDASDIITWRYVFVISSKVFDKKLSYFKLVNILNVIISLVLCGILIYFFAKKNVRPFSKLRMIYNKGEENDITLIDDVLNDYRSAKQAQSKAEQANLVEELINTGQPKLLDELKKYEINFPYQYFCVILFKLVNVSRLFEDENDISSPERYDSVKLIIKNVLEEIINEKHYAHICKINGQIVAVVNINNDYIIDFRNDIEEMLSRGREFISSRFAFSYTPFVGGIHDVKTIHESYSEAIKALQYRTFIPASDIVFCDDANAENKTSEESVIIPEEKKRQLINLLQLGDTQASLSVANSLMLAAPRQASSKHRVFLIDLISTLIRALENIGRDDVEMRFSDELCSLVENPDISVVSEKIKEIITELCRLTAERDLDIGTKDLEGSISKKDIVSDIKKFISENYTNQALNIAMIGEYFNITPYYVSNIFKKSENISMLDYISITRIEKAKELLVTTDLNIETIALQCGFSNIRTFMRVFQKFEIITPGKYKEINKK